MTRSIPLLGLALLLATLSAHAQSPQPGTNFGTGPGEITPLTANTTSACNPSPQKPQAGCSANFNGLSDHYPTIEGAPAPHIDTTVTVPPASNVSDVPFSALLYPGYHGRVKTQVVCHLQIWWGSPLHKGNPMDQSNPATVDRQIQNTIDRGCNEVTFDWYGSGYTDGHRTQPDAAFLDTVVQRWQSNLDARCRAANGACPLRYALMEDVGTETGRGKISSFETDLRYAEASYFTHPSYWSMHVAGCTQRPVVLAFGWGWPDGTWAQLKDWIHAGDGLNRRCAGEPLLVINGEEGLRFQHTDGSYNWVGINSYSNDQPGEVTVPGVSGTGQFDTHFESHSGYSEADWYRAAAVSDKPVKIGSVYAGFNNTNTSYGFKTDAGHPYGWVISRECGLVWVNAWKQLTAGGLFSSKHQLGYMGIVTWNDYEEGTAIETGIDNCVETSSIRGSVQGHTLSWSYRFGTSGYGHIAGSPITIHHYALWARSGNHWTELSNHQHGIAGVSCSSLGERQYRCHAPLPAAARKQGHATLYLELVGQPSIQNHLSQPLSH